MKNGAEKINKDFRPEDGDSSKSLSVRQPAAAFAGAAGAARRPTMREPASGC